MWGVESRWSSVELVKIWVLLWKLPSIKHWVQVHLPLTFCVGWGLCWWWIFLNDSLSYSTMFSLWICTSEKFLHTFDPKQQTAVTCNYKMLTSLTAGARGNFFVVLIQLQSWTNPEFLGPMDGLPRWYFSAAGLDL